MPNERDEGYLTKDEWIKIGDLTRQCADSCRIDPKFYSQYDVKKGLRDLDGRGVLAGLTEISEVKATAEVDGKRVPAPGELYYRGYNVNDLVKGFLADKRFGFEEATYLLLTGKLPSARELRSFCDLLGEFYTLPKNFVRDIIMKSPSEDMMNSLMRCVISLFPYDPNPNNTAPDNVMRQCLQLIAQVPIFSVYSYAASSFYNKSDSLVIHRPRPDLSMAENILYMLRQDCSYTELEARVLDMALVLHAEHGGGNNSSFTTHVVTSSGRTWRRSWTARRSITRGSSTASVTPCTASPTRAPRSSRDLSKSCPTKRVCTTSTTYMRASSNSRPRSFPRSARCTRASRRT